MGLKRALLVMLVALMAMILSTTASAVNIVNNSSWQDTLTSSTAKQYACTSTWVTTNGESESCDGSATGDWIPFCTAYKQGQCNPDQVAAQDWYIAGSGYWLRPLQTSYAYYGSAQCTSPCHVKTASLHRTGMLVYVGDGGLTDTQARNLSEKVSLTNAPNPENHTIAGHGTGWCTTSYSDPTNTRHCWDGMNAGLTLNDVTATHSWDGTLDKPAGRNEAHCKIEISDPNLAGGINEYGFIGIGDNENDSYASYRKWDAATSQVRGSTLDGSYYRFTSADAAAGQNIVMGSSNGNESFVLSFKHTVGAGGVGSSDDKFTCSVSRYETTGQGSGYVLLKTVEWSPGHTWSPDTNTACNHVSGSFCNTGQPWNYATDSSALSTYSVESGDCRYEGGSWASGACTVDGSVATGRYTGIKAKVGMDINQEEDSGTTGFSTYCVGQGTNCYYVGT